jgi:hypothetical protein
VKIQLWYNNFMVNGRWVPIKEYKESLLYTYEYISWCSQQGLYECRNLVLQNAVANNGTTVVFPLFPTLLELIKRGQAAPYHHAVTTSDTYSTVVTPRLFPPWSQFNSWLCVCEPMNTIFFTVLWSRSRKEPHLLVGAGAVTRCGSGSDGGIYHG